jgi:hypothetical protein
MATTTAPVRVGSMVTYHGSVIEAHGRGHILAVHGNGRVDIRVTDLAYRLRPGRFAWVEIGSLVVRDVRPQSWKPCC